MISYNASRTVTVIVTVTYLSPSIQTLTVCSPPNNDWKSQEQSNKVISTANAKDRNLFSNLQPSSIESKRGCLTNVSQALKLNSMNKIHRFGTEIT